MFEYRFTNKHYHTLDYYLKTKYKKKVFKVSLNASFTCPNRDGTKGTGGCLFCSGLGSGDFAGDPKESLYEQFEKVKSVISQKWPDALYIVYFQAYSNTYGSIEKMKETFETFINYPDVIGMSIATRCDCLDKEKVEYLADLSKHFLEFWIELGLQSSKKETMELLNLKYTFNDFKKATRLLNKYQIKVIAHIIDGLPYESKEDQLNTIKDLNKLKIDGLKIHILNIIDNTKLGLMYKENPFEILTEQQFIDIAINQIALLNDNVIIHRIGADSKKEELIAPSWVSKKLKIMDSIDLMLESLDIYQGDNN